ncbi:MAG: PAN domain-containing protein, partial [Pseudomonadota bacterium]
MRAVSLFAFACLLATPIAGEEGFSHEQNTYRFGGTYKMFSGESADECAIACELDGKCKAWSFQRETAGLGAARCELKRTIGPQEANPLMISGISPRLSNVGVALDG